MNISKRTAYILMASAAIMWGTSGVLTAAAIDNGATANQVAVYACVISAMILLPVIHLFDRPSLRLDRRDLPAMLLFATITGSMFSLAWYNCIDLTSVTTAVILLYSYPSLVTVASVFLLKERLTTAKAIALPLTFIGCLLVSGAYDIDKIRLNLMGIGLGIYTALAATVYYLWTKKWLRKYSANTVALYMALLTVPGVILASNPAVTFGAALGLGAWGFIVLIAIVPSTVAFVISMVALKHIEASKASIVASLEPVSGVILAVVLIAERVDALQVAGVVLVLMGVVILRLVRPEEDEELVETPPIK